ncbi:response regulator [Pseudomonas wadenswilerensis]|uniref:Virulence factors putative positive transcription regulator n=1 Tax=Pseudomonas wadenswilerensis TaxID=1785161 RepID=A0A380SYW1_9PSED|nr:MULTISPECIES: response regulator [Pseudomonas]MCE5980764.1 response regulator [Pseudomonas sp. LF19]SPO66641.1 putative Virulence factors positive transcription regulator BvgA [Pseudomonas sp. JV241A]SUQ62905.1 Virulence factors putative positive transcription regulator [Pseudomonas wadenswilerensis]
MPTVLIVDDHPTIRLAVRMLLERERYEVVGETGDGVAAVQMARELRPDVVILDIGLPGLDGLSVIKRLHLLENTPKIMVLTGQPAGLFARRCLDAGSSAFVHKDEDLEALIFALKAMVKGYSTFPDMSANRGPLGSEEERLSSLSHREMEVLRMLAAGLSNNDIGERMLLSPKTISTYKSRIMEKLQVGSFVDLMGLAHRNQVI